MLNVERVTVTLPDDLLRDIDRREKNRSKLSLSPKLSATNWISAAGTTCAVRCNIPILKAPLWPSKDSRNGRAPSPARTPNLWWMLRRARPFVGSPEKAGWKGNETMPRFRCAGGTRSHGWS